jgi:hypothetical protein
MSRNWRTLAALVLAICLVALVVHPTAAGFAALAALVLVPVALLGLVEVPRSLWPALDLELALAVSVLPRASLFQRPPPASLP